MYSIFLLSLLLSLLVKVEAFRLDCIKVSNGTYFLLQPKLQLLRQIPDIETLHELGFDLPSVSKANAHYIYGPAILNYTDNELSSMLAKGKVALGKPLTSLKKASYDPDNLIRVVYEKIGILNPLYFKEVGSKSGLMNPAFARWRNRTLSSWGKASNRRSQEDKKLRLGWIGNDKRVVDFDTDFTSTEAYGIGGSFSSDSYIPLDTSRFAYLEDSRMILLNDKMYISYAAVDPKGVVWLNQIVASMEEGKLKLGEHVLIEQSSQKNWVPFEFQGRVLYLSSINPMRIVEILPANQSATGTGGEDVGSFNVVVSKETIKTLPWNPFYGEILRGGTPAMKVRGVYLTFFHTKASVQPGFKLSTYFMGAMTMCPDSPFDIHSMSPLPILKGEWYTSNWLFPSIDYCVFPSGLIVDQDNEHVWVYMGYQDNFAKLLKFNIDDLFASMEVVSDCGAKASNSTSRARLRRAR